MTVKAAAMDVAAACFHRASMIVFDKLEFDEGDVQ